MDTNTLIQSIQAGQNELRDQLIGLYLPLIKRIVQQATGSFDVERLDEYSIAMLSLNEAIDRFRPGQRLQFPGYAEMVIRHRLIDWQRSQKPKLQTVPIADGQEDESGLPAFLISERGNAAIDDPLAFAQAAFQIESQLRQFGLRFPDLVKHFPRHRDSRLFCIRLARAMHNNPDLFQHLVKKKRLPNRKLADLCQTSVKTIERNRTSIILLVVLMKSDLGTIQHYIRHYEKQEEANR